MKRRRVKRKGGRQTRVPASHVVTQLPTAIATTPAPSNNFVANGTNNNILLDDGNLAAANAVASSQLFQEGYGFDAILPDDALITKVEVLVKNKQDGAAANPRPGAILRYNGVLEDDSWHEQTSLGTSLAEFVWDLTPTPSLAPSWGKSAWDRSMLLDAVFKTGIRARQTGTPVSSIFSWDYIKVRVTYTGSDPSTPVIPRYTLSVATTGDGAGKVTGPGIDTSTSDTSETFPKGTQVPLLATAGPTSVFDGWSSGGSVNPLVLDIEADRSIDAAFVGTPPGDPVGLHLGAILAEDLSTVADASAVWKSLSSPYQEVGADGSGNPVDPTSDPWFTRRSGDGSPFVPVGQGSPSANYRRLTTGTPPAQSVYDHGADPYPSTTASTRTQATPWSQIAANTFHLFAEGDRTFTLIDFRSPNPNPLPNAQAPGGGNILYSQIIQWKAKKPGDGYIPILRVTLGSDALKVVCQFDNAGTLYQDIVPITDGLWQRLAFETLHSSNPAVGYYRVWGKIDEAADWVQLTPQRSMQLLYPSSISCIGIGPYYAMTLLPAGNIFVDYANVQVCAYV